MRSNAKATDALRAIAKMAERTFNKGSWIDLGLATDTLSPIESHGRLLQSLKWNDSDYSGNVLDAMPRVLGLGYDDRVTGTAAECFPNLRAVEDHMGLQPWLADHEPKLHAALYSGSSGAELESLNEAARAMSVPEIDEHARRIRGGLQADPDLAVGSAKELLETVLKAILELHGGGPETKLEIPALVKQANVKLGLDAAGVSGADPGAEQRRRVLGGLGNIVNATAELRNAGLGTGHGHSRGPALDEATARLVVTAAVAVATFYVEADAATGSKTATDTEIPF